MTRQTIINGIVSAAMGYGGMQLALAGNPVLGSLLVVAWLIGMMNSLIPEDAP